MLIKESSILQALDVEKHYVDLYKSIENREMYNNLSNTGFKPIKIIHNNNATIVLWNDNTKTVIKGSGDDLFAAFCICFAKKCCNGSTVLNKLFESAEKKGCIFYEHEVGQL